MSTAIHTPEAITTFKIFEELTKFNHVKFSDDGHVYYIHRKYASSVTKVLGGYKEPFDADYWSKKKAKEQGITPQEMLYQWRVKRETATHKGNNVHNYIEDYLSNKLYAYQSPTDDAVDVDQVRDAYAKIIPMVGQFCADIKGKMIPIKSEFVIGDTELMIGGMIDQIFYNKKSNKLELWDWKTNKEIKTESNYGLLPPVSHLTNSELHTYSLQLAFYRYIIEKYTELEFGDNYICWFNEKNEQYKIFKCLDLRDEINAIVEDYKRNQSSSK